MDSKQRYVDYKERYISEIDARFKIDASLKAPPGLFLIVFALLAFIFNQTIAEETVPNDFWFWILYSLAGIFFTIALAFYAKAIYGYTYALIPTPQELENYFNQLVNYYSEHFDNDSEKQAEEAFEKYMETCYLEYATQNTKNNDTKLLNLSRCVGSIICAFVLACITYLPLYAFVLKGE